MFAIGRFSFSSKAACERHIRDMFWRYPPMGVLQGEDLEFALALILKHEYPELMIGCGVKCIKVQPVPLAEETQRRYLIIRGDDSPMDISWRHILHPRNPRQKLQAACRHAIRPQIAEFKESHFEGRCETCGIALTAEACHVDHILPRTFDWLVDEWLKTVRLTPELIAILPGRHYGENSDFEDLALKQSWIEYHEINARLRCVCRRCNLSTLRASPQNSHAGKK